MNVRAVAAVNKKASPTPVSVHGLRSVCSSSWLRPISGRMSVSPKRGHDFNEVQVYSSNETREVGLESLVPLRNAILQRKCACNNQASGDDCAECSKKRPSLRRANLNPGLETRNRDGMPPIVHEVLRSPGQPIDPETRAFFESRFGHDFSRVSTQSISAQTGPALTGGEQADPLEREADELSDRILSSPAEAAVDSRYDFSAVRVHTDALASASTQAVGAMAYTVGHHIAFGMGNYAPCTPEGRKLLAHELMHVVQQNHPAGNVSLQRRPGPPAATATNPLLSRVSNVGLKINSKPQIIRQPGNKDTVDVLIFPPLKLTGTASVTAGPDQSNFEFGFLQLGRPFEIARATYHELGAPPGGKRDLDFNASDNIRKLLPALDHSSFWFSDKEAKKGSSSVQVNYDDLPSQFFETEIGKNGKYYGLTGLALQSFLFTAFAVKLPDGSLHPLKTFYWDIKYCERIAPGTDLKRNVRKASPINISPVSDCASGCNANEPGFDKIHQPRSTDTYLAAVLNGRNSASILGPDDFDIGCAQQ